MPPPKAAHGNASFVLTARAENFLFGRPDLADTIRRLQAFQEAGADVLFAPGLTSLDQIRAVVSSVERPVNVIMGLDGVGITLAQLQEAGVKRVSVGSSFARAALGAFQRAAPGSARSWHLQLCPAGDTLWRSEQGFRWMTPAGSHANCRMRLCRERRRTGRPEISGKTA